MNSENSFPEPENSNYELESWSQSPTEESSEKTSDAVEDIWSAESSDFPDTLPSIQEESTAIERSIVPEVDLDFNSAEATATPTTSQSEVVSEIVSEKPASAASTSDENSDDDSESPELFVDRWLDEAEIAPSDSNTVAKEIEDLQQQKADLLESIGALKAEQEQLRSQQVQMLQAHLVQMIEEGTKELQERKSALRIEIDKLERRKERINEEMRSNFAGSSKELAIRVQGFKEYLVGSLQDLSRAAEKLELVGDAAPPRRRETRQSRDRESVREDRGSARGRQDRDARSSRRSPEGREDRGSRRSSKPASATQFNEPTFADQSRRIRQLLDKYCNSPDYYGSPWQLRRTFEPTQAKKVQDWFFVQGGRGAIDSSGSRLQNILLASAVISILHGIYGDRSRVLVLTDTPENLGEWRRGMQDCLGISRNDFGSNRGVTLFDAPEILVQRAERLLADKLLPIIIVDETEELLNLSVLKFPIWLAFASTNKSVSSNYLY